MIEADTDRLRTFARSLPAEEYYVDVEGTRLFVASVEDVIIAKLEWAQLGESARQLEDVVALLRLRGKAIDEAYVDRWTKALGLGEQWTEARRRAKMPN